MVAVCDINPEVFDRFYGRAEIARGGIGEYADYREMFAKENLDVVSVATPDHLHVDPVCDASDAGIRGILCEKPLANSVAEADRMVDAAATAPGVALCGFSYRRTPALAARLTTAPKSGLNA